MGDAALAIFKTGTNKDHCIALGTPYSMLCSSLGQSGVWVE